MGGREGAGRGVTHFMSAALSGSIRLSFIDEVT